MRGYYGIGVYNLQKKINLGTLWRSAHCFDAKFIFTIGKEYKLQSSDTTKASKHLPYFKLFDFEEFMKFIPHDCIPIGVELTEESQNIYRFVHPERAIYILGPENGSLPKTILNKCGYVIEIPSKQCLNVATAGSIVMYDRRVKNEGN